MSTLNKPFKGSGEIMIRERLAGVGFDEFGNCSALTFAINETKSTQKDYRTTQGGNAASSSTIDDVTGSITGLSYQRNVLAIALRGLVEVIEATPIVDEVISINVGKAIKLAHIPDKTATITVQDNTDDATRIDLVEGTDYNIVGSMLKLTAYAPLVGDTAPGVVSYTPKVQYKIKGLSSTTTEYELVFNGYNLADNDAPVMMNVFRIKFSAAQALDLITEDYSELPIEFEVLSDENAVDPDNRYFELKMIK